MKASTAEKSIIFILRLLSINALLALVFLVMPEGLIAGIHKQIGLGEMPQAPVAGYLSRSLCLFYGVLGIHLWIVSTDLNYYRPLLRVYRWLFPAMGAVFLAIDIHEGLPLWWILLEGPFLLCVGAIFIWLTGQLGKYSSKK